MRSFAVLLLVTLVLSLQWAAAPIAHSGPPDPPGAAPNLLPTTPFTDNMECPSRVIRPGTQGAVPAGWTGALISAAAPPDIENDRWYFGGQTCGEPNPPWTFIERMEGQDSWIFMAADWATPPTPGKPFDAAFYQQIRVTPGAAYSLSAWMLSLCGGSDPRGACPDNYWIAKMIGIDPTGGTEPLAGSVHWIENRVPHVLNGQRTGWQNLRMGATAQSITMTLFARINSPFQWAANQAFLDAVEFVHAPTAAFVALPAQVHGRQITVNWNGDLGADISAIPKQHYQLYFDLDYRIDNGTDGWQPWLRDEPAGSRVFTVLAGGFNPVVHFRIMPRAEQPVCPSPPCDWAYPNHRFPGVWLESGPVRVTIDPPGPPAAFVPVVQK